MRGALQNRGMDPETDALTARLRYPEGVAGASGFTHSYHSIERKRLRCNVCFFMSICMYEALRTKLSHCPNSHHAIALFYFYLTVAWKQSPRRYV